MDFETHTAVTLETHRILGEEMPALGFPVPELVEISLGEYHGWLSDRGLENSPGARAAFVSFKNSPPEE